MSCPLSRDPDETEQPVGLFQKMVGSLARPRVSAASDNHPLSPSVLDLAMHAMLLRDGLVCSLDQLALPGLVGPGEQRNDRPDCRQGASAGSGGE